MNFNDVYSLCPSQSDKRLFRDRVISTTLSIIGYLLILGIGVAISGCDDDPKPRMSAEDSSAGDSSAGDSSAGDSSAGDSSAGDSSAGESLAGDSLAGDSLAGENTAGENTAGENTAGEERPPPMIPDTLPREGQGIVGATELPLTPPSGLRVGVVDEESEVFSGQDISCRLGSTRIENSLITACIQGEYSLTQFKRKGGNLVDLMQWTDLSSDGISEIIFGPGLGEVNPEEIKVIADGSEGGPAIVQVRGVSAGSRILTSYLPSFVPRRMRVTTEYHLYEGRRELELHTWVEIGEQAISIQIADFVIWADPSVYFYPLREGERIPPNLPFIGAHLPKISYLWRVLGVDELRVMSLPGLPFQPVLAGQFEAPGGSILYVKRSILVGDGGVSPLANQFGSLPAEARQVQLKASFNYGEGSVTDLNDDLLQDTSVEIYTLSEAGEPAALIAQDRLKRDQSGEFNANVSLSPGTYWVIAPQWFGGQVTQQITITTGEGIEEVELSLLAPAQLTLSERFIDQIGELITPTLRGTKWIFTPRGESNVGRQRIISFVLGEDTLSLPAGEWELQVSRGWHFSLYQQSLTLLPGETRELSAALTEELPLSGWSAGEFHQHSAPSLDSEIAYKARILSNIVEGVGFMVPSDHDVMADYPNLVRRFGYQGDIGAPITGLEISPRVGHLGAYGIAYQADDPNGAGGAPPLSMKVTEGEEGRPDTWRLRTIPELIEEARERGAEIIQVNHPRDSTGYFDTVDFDPTSGESPTQHEQWTADFDTIEVFNGAGDFCAVMRDWQALLLQGERITAVGNSDSHSLGRPVGYPRNYLPTTASRAIDITRDEIVSALKGAQASIGGGAYLQLSGGLTWGDTLNGTDISVSLSAHTPSFSQLTKLRALFNGQELWSQALESEREALTDFEDTINLNVPHDGFLVFLAEGPRLEAVHPGQPTFALGNPLWIDADGDGRITLPTPYVAPAELTTLFCP